MHFNFEWNYLQTKPVFYASAPYSFVELVIELLVYPQWAMLKSQATFYFSDY